MTMRTTMRMTTFLLIPKGDHGWAQRRQHRPLRCRAPKRQQFHSHNTRATIPLRRLFRREATVTAQWSVTSLTRLIATALEAALAQLVLTARSLLVLVLPAWRRRSRMMSNLLPRHQRTLELDRLPLDFTPDILELAPYPQIFVPEQLVTARGDPSVVDTWRGRTWRSLRSVAPASGPDGHSVRCSEKRQE